MKVLTFKEIFTRDNAEEVLKKLDGRVNRARPVDLKGDIVSIQDNIITISDFCSSTFMIIRTLSIKELSKEPSKKPNP